jgi:tRNA-splicing ligase RtcB
MNKKELLALGVPADCVPSAVAGIHAAAKAGELKEIKPKQLIPQIVSAPSLYSSHPFFGPLAQALLSHDRATVPRDEPIPFAQWGDDIDEASKMQMKNACRLPVSVAAALMPDAHSGYGLPIGGVLACDNAVVPYAVGVDIACRMRLTVTDLPPAMLETNDAIACQSLDKALEKGTRFGMGGAWERPHEHAVFDEDWTVTAVTREMKDRAWRQLGTSGSGNHFVEWGLVELPHPDLGLEAGKYVALLSHSGSRGAGARVCNRYSDIAQKSVPSRFREDSHLKHLSWLSLDSEDGQSYWNAMNLMGRYAAANHEVIHENVTQLAGATALAVVENHHNFAWKERHGDRDYIVHRKGATPAGEGVLGVIPGNMADAAFIVRGKGVAASLNSASHGAGRRMSRTAARNQFNWRMWRDYLSERKVRLLAGGIDEAPGAYKDIRQVMQAQSDLVDVVGTFQPRIVMMCGDDSPAED